MVRSLGLHLKEGIQSSWVEFEATNSIRLGVFEEVAKESSLVGLFNVVFKAFLGSRSRMRIK